MKHILVLYSFSTILPAQAEIDQGLRAALQKDSRYPVDLDIEVGKKPGTNQPHLGLKPKGG